MKKKKFYASEAPKPETLGEANQVIQELWTKLREYEDRLAQSSRNSSKSPSQDTPEAKAERKKLKSLVAQIRLALSQGIPGTKDR